MMSKWWHNHESEGTPVSVGPFKSEEDGRLFEELMFTGPVGDVSRTADAERMTVRQFQDAFRADFIDTPPAHWRARW